MTNINKVHYDKLYTVSEVVTFGFLGLKEGTIYKYIKSGELHSYDYGSGDKHIYRIPGASIIKFLDQLKSNNTNE